MNLNRKTFHGDSLDFELNLTERNLRERRNSAVLDAKAKAITFDHVEILKRLGKFYTQGELKIRTSRGTHIRVYSNLLKLSSIFIYIYILFKLF